jgi:alkanesulfonate monooxygenase SsuD/methylene tetrahydromethanopterin reductase-like flavin-dependent oxidoreductase (luciferase family)
MPANACFARLMTTFGNLEDTDIDVAIDEQEAGERRSMELATRIRLVAAEDPELAQDLVDELIVALDRAMGGTFREYLDGEARDVAERASIESGSGNSPARDS